MNLFDFLASDGSGLETALRCYKNKRGITKYRLEIDGLRFNGEKDIESVAVAGHSILECFEKMCDAISNKTYISKLTLNGLKTIATPELTIDTQNILGQNAAGWIENKEGRLKVR